MLLLACNFFVWVSFQEFTTPIIFDNGRVFNYLATGELVLAVLQNICLFFPRCIVLSYYLSSSFFIFEGKLNHLPFLTLRCSCLV